MERRKAHKRKPSGRTSKYITPTSFRFPVALTRKLKAYVLRFKPLVKKRVTVAIWALEDFMERHNSQEELENFIEEWEEKKGIQKTIKTK